MNFDEVKLPARPAIKVWQLAPLLLNHSRLRERCFGWLSAAERDRQANFQDDRQRHLDLATRALCRWVLSKAVGIEPGDLEFGMNEFGKPFMTAPATSIAFNISHADDLIACAVAHGIELGVDVMNLATPIDVAALRHHFLSAEESASIERLPETDRKAMSQRIWVAKEAALKAAGTGMAVPPESVTVLFLADRNTATCGEFFMRLCRPTPRHIAAVAVPLDCSSVGIEWHDATPALQACIAVVS